MDRKLLARQDSNLHGRGESLKFHQLMPKAFRLNLSSLTASLWRSPTRGHALFFGYVLKISEKAEKSRLNFAPVPIFHGLSSDDVALARFGGARDKTSVAHNDKTFALVLFLIALPITLANAKVKVFRKSVVAVEGADFELLGADGVVVFHVVFLVTGKDTTKRGKCNCFLFFFCSVGVLGKLPTQARLA